MGAEDPPRGFPAAPPAPQAPQRLLIVDDEQVLAKLMERILRSRGFESDIALSAAEARKRIEGTFNGWGLHAKTVTRHLDE